MGDGTLGGGGRRAADGAGRRVPMSTAVFFLATSADGAEPEERMSWAGGAKGADVTGRNRLLRAGGSSGCVSATAAAAASGVWTGSMDAGSPPHGRVAEGRVEPPNPKVRSVLIH